MYTPTKDERTLTLLCHLSGILTGFIGPLVFWLVKKDESTFINDQAKEALNFQITLAIAYVVLSVLSVISCGVMLVVFPVIYVGSIVLMVIAGMKANEGISYRYPLTLRLIN